MLQFARRFFRHPLSAVRLLAIFFCFALASKRAQLRSFREQEEQLLSEWVAAKQQSAALRAERDSLLTDLFAVEAVAREHYGYALPGERSSTLKVGPKTAAAAAVHVALPEDPWDRLLGRGGFPFLALLAIFAVSATAFAILEIISSSRSSERAL